jgi:hypothetical protein
MAAWERRPEGFSEWIVGEPHVSVAVSCKNIEKFMNGTITLLGTHDGYSPLFFWMLTDLNELIYSEHDLFGRCYQIGQLI